MRIGKPTHYKKPGEATACGIPWVPYHSDVPGEVNCLRCLATKKFPGRKSPKVLKCEKENERAET